MGTIKYSWRKWIPFVLTAGVISPILLPEDPTPPDLGSYDPGPKYPYNCAVEDDRCDEERFKSFRWWSAFRVRWYFGFGSQNIGIPGSFRNAVSHCAMACFVHSEMPECDYKWEQSEWDMKTRLPKDFASDLDIRNNAIGADLAYTGVSCLDACYKSALLYCDDGNGKIVRCKLVVAPLDLTELGKRERFLDGSYIDNEGIWKPGFGPKY